MPDNNSTLLGSTVNINTTVDDSGDHPQPPDATPLSVAPQAIQTGRRKRFDADAANQRAADRASWFSSSAPSYGSPSSSYSAPATAGSTFDAFAYDESIHAQNLANAGSAPPAGGWDSPPPPPQSDPVGDRLNDPAAGGMYSRVDDLSALRESAQEQLSPRASSASRYASYDEAVQSRSNIIDEAKNIYTSSGRFSEIGSPGFNRETQSALATAGLAVAPEVEEAESSAKTAAKEALNRRNMFKFSLGYGMMQLGEESGHLYEQENSGQYLTPEQRTSASAGLLPGVGGIAGAAIGMAFGNPMIGGMAGAGIGSAVQGIVTGNEGRGQATREAAERLAAAMGEAASSVSTLRTQIEATGTPIQQFTQALGSAGSVGTFGPGTVAGIGALASAFGEYGQEDFSVMAQYSSGPLRHGLGALVSSGAIDATGIQSMGFDAAENGDFTGLKTLQQTASRALVKNDPAYQAAAKTLTDATNSQFGLGAAPVAVARWARSHGLPVHNDLTAAMDTEDERQSALSGSGDPAVAAQNLLINQFADLQSAQIVANSGIKVAQSGIGLALARGGSAAQIGTASEALYSSLADARASTQSEIALYQADLADPLRSQGREPELKAKIADATARMTGFDVAAATQRRDVFKTGLGEEEAKFGTFVDRATLSGRSAASMQSGYNRQEEFLSGVAADPRNRLDPTERAGIEDSALRMRYRAAQQLYGEENAELDVTRAGRSAATSYAATYGSPLDAYNAGMAGLQSDRDQIAQNSSELTRGNLTNLQKLGLTRQNVGLESDLATRPEQLRVAAYDAEGGILSSQQAESRAQLSRNVAIYGSSAYTPAMLGLDQDAVTHFAGAESGSPFGSPQRARYGQERADAQARLTDDGYQSQTYRETASQRTQDTVVEHSFERAMRAPYLEGGAESSPFTRGQALLGNLRGRLGEAEGSLSRSSDPLAREQNTAIVEGLKDRISDIEMERRRGFLAALPEEIAGSPGRGATSGIIPTAGQSSFFAASPFITGSFGAPPHGLISEGAGPAATPGGVAGRMIASQGGMPAGGEGAVLAGLLGQIRDLLQRGVMPGGRSAVVPSPAGFSQNTNLYLDPQHPGR